MNVPAAQTSSARAEPSGRLLSMLRRRGTTRRRAGSPGHPRGRRLEDEAGRRRLHAGSAPANRSPCWSRHVHSGVTSRRASPARGCGGRPPRRWRRAPSPPRPRAGPRPGRSATAAPPSSRSKAAQCSYPRGSTAPPDHSWVASRIRRSPITTTVSSPASPTIREAPAGAVAAQQPVVSAGAQPRDRAAGVAAEAVGHQPLARRGLVEGAAHAPAEGDPRPRVTAPTAGPRRTGPAGRSGRPPARSSRSGGWHRARRRCHRGSTR